MYFQGKKIVFSVHAIKRARQRKIAFPDLVYKTIATGKTIRFAKNNIKFIGRRVICIGEDLGSVIIIKTVEKK